jgi:hypothetical protein
MAKHAEVNEYTTMMRLLLDGEKFLKDHVDTRFKHQHGSGESSSILNSIAAIWWNLLSQAWWI